MSSRLVCQNCLFCPPKVVPLFLTANKVSIIIQLLIFSAVFRIQKHMWVNTTTFGRFEDSKVVAHDTPLYSAGIFLLAVENLWI